MDLERNEVLSPGKYKKVVEARSVVCYWAMREIVISQSVLAQKFSISQPAVSMTIKWGEQVVNRNNLNHSEVILLSVYHAWMNDILLEIA
ncbi:MAG: hypothetical protein LWX08_15985 [Deltaproteobacteria bacterium]|jgi:hypothetical protein|nr:hypothetical protein [Deltaproteobacteria bacterium]